MFNTIINKSLLLYSCPLSDFKHLIFRPVSFSTLYIIEYLIVVLQEINPKFSFALVHKSDIIPGASHLRNQAGLYTSECTNSNFPALNGWPIFNFGIFPLETRIFIPSHSYVQVVGSKEFMPLLHPPRLLHCQKPSSCKVYPVFLPLATTKFPLVTFH